MKNAIMLTLAAALPITPLIGQEPGQDDDRARLLVAAVDHLRAERPTHPAHGPEDQFAIDPGDAFRADQQFMRQLSSLTQLRAARTDDIRPQTLGHLVTLRRVDDGWVVADVSMLWRS
jgi:hypothetical protein